MMKISGLCVLSNLSHIPLSLLPLFANPVTDYRNEKCLKAYSSPGLNATYIESCLLLFLDYIVIYTTFTPHFKGKRKCINAI